MIVTTFAGGSQTATIATEHFVATPTAAGHYQIKVDLASMAAGDVTELRIYGMAAAGGNSRAVYLGTYYGVPPTDAVLAHLPTIVNDHSGSNAVRFSIKQTFGTGRVYDWAVMAWGHQAGLDQLTNQVWATPVRITTSVASPVAVASNYDKGNYTLSTTAVLAVADGLLDRDMATGADTGSTTVRTVRQSLRGGRNKVDLLGGVVYKEDDATVSWTFVVASDSSTDRIISMDPAGP